MSDERSSSLDRAPARSGQPMPRVAIAGVFHETNTFATSRTDLDAFGRRNGWLEGEQLAATFAGTRTVVGGMLDEADRHGLTTVPIFGAYATPAGTVTAHAFEAASSRLLEGLTSAHPLDGLLLELHGAMVVEGVDAAETVLLQRIRDIVGDVPLAAVTDLHANIDPASIPLVDVLVGYRTNPHVDTFESGADAARHVSGLVRGGPPTTLTHVGSRVVAAPIAQASAELPLLRLLQRARELERRHRFLDVTVHGGYAFADVAHAGLAFTITAATTGHAAAQDAVEELAALGWEQRHGFEVDLPDPHTAVEIAARLARDSGDPVAIADTGDNIGGGAPGDGTWLLQAILDVGRMRTATTMCDPSSVRAAADAGVGATVELELGGHSEPLGGPPVVTAAVVRELGDGTFTNRGPMAHGAGVTMGPTAVVSVGSVDVVVQSEPVQPNDPELFRSVGIEPLHYDLLVLKGAAALRAGWSPIVSGFVDAGTSGVTDCDLTRLPYRRLRDAWPLSEHAGTTTPDDPPATGGTP